MLGREEWLAVSGLWLAETSEELGVRSEEWRNEVEPSADTE